MKQYKYFHTSSSWSSRGDGKYPACAAIVKITPPTGGHSYVYSISRNGNVCLARMTQPQNVRFCHAVYGPMADLKGQYAFDYLRLREEGGVFEADATDADRNSAGTDIEEIDLVGEETSPVYSFNPAFYATAVDRILAGKTVVFKAGDCAEEFVNALLRLFPRQYANTIGFITTPGCSLSELLGKNTAGSNLDLRIIVLGGNYIVKAEDRRMFPAVCFLDSEELTREKLGAYADAVLQFLKLTKNPQVLLEKFFKALSLDGGSAESVLKSENLVRFVCNATIFNDKNKNAPDVGTSLTCALNVVKAYVSAYPNGMAPENHRKIGVNAATYALQVANRYEPAAVVTELSSAAMGLAAILHSAEDNSNLIKAWKEFLCRCIGRGVALPEELKPAEILKEFTFTENDFMFIDDEETKSSHTVDSFKTLYEIAKVAGAGTISPEAARFLARYIDVGAYLSVFDPELAENCGSDEENRANILAILALSAVDPIEKTPENRDPARDRFCSVCCACAKYGKDAPEQAVMLWLKICDKLYTWCLRDTPDATKRAVGDAMREMRRNSADPARDTTMNVLYGEAKLSPEEKLEKLFRLSDKEHFDQDSVKALGRKDPDLYEAIASEFVAPSLVACISFENYEKYGVALEYIPASDRENGPVRKRIEEAKLVAVHLETMTQSRREFIEGKYNVLPPDKQREVVRRWIKRGTEKAGRDDKIPPREGKIITFVTDKERCKRLGYNEVKSLVCASESLREVYNRYEPAPQPWSESRTHFLNCRGKDFFLSFILGMMFALVAAALLFIYPAIRAHTLGEKLFVVAQETLHVYDLTFPVLAYFLFQIGFLTILDRRKRKELLDYEAKERTRNAFWHAANFTFFVVIISEIMMIATTIAVYFLMPIWLSL